MPAPPRTFFQAFVSRPVVLQALRVAAVVGPTLLVINHGELVVTRPLSAETLGRLAMNLAVPYLVSSYSSARIALRDAAAGPR